MKLIQLTVTATLVACVIAGCTAQQLDTLRQDQARAETVYAAATQATATAKAALTSVPATAPGRTQADQVVAASEKGEQAARAALDLANATLQAAQNDRFDDPAFVSAVQSAVGVIPSPWTPVLASLVPAVIPLLVSIRQSFKLGQAHQTVQQVTQQLEEHKAALEKLTTVPAVPDAAKG